MSHIAVVGLGLMGGSAAIRLSEAADVEVRGFDLDPAARARVAAEGVTATSTLEDAVRGASVVFTSLPNSDIVRRVWLGTDGIIAFADPGAVLVELSTIDPDTMRALGAAASERGIGVVDSPVSGGPGEARAGTLTLLVGGDDEVVESIADTLALVGTTRRTGDLGSGKITKIVNNMMGMGNVLVAAEAFALGVTAGVDPHVLYGILSQSGGTSSHFTKRFPKALAGDFEPGFSIELGEKDLALAQQLARSRQMPVPTASLARDLYAMARVEGQAGKDIVAILRMYEQWGQNGSELD
ncbi:NAD(P)-dependent oxidoreductase [Microbacterium aoyamense]|uniref:NAD(P)-dependent oxidoreductase n=1 Tax=Microbacterium aoyamense TaxID=344166 RepID=A0ABP5ASK6_9MICO|nr:NAD(P)-dependent oxidoreductase [Microbacterium aoyamense]